MCYGKLLFTVYMEKTVILAPLVIFFFFTVCNEIQYCSATDCIFPHNSHPLNPHVSLQLASVTRTLLNFEIRISIRLKLRVGE